MPRKLRVTKSRKTRARKLTVRKSRVRRMNRRVMKTLYDDDDLGLGVADMPTMGNNDPGFQTRARQAYRAPQVEEMVRHGGRGRPIHRGRNIHRGRRYH